MEAFEAIHTRRSIRKYEDQPVPEGINPHSLVLLGCPAEQRQSEDRYEAGRV